MMWRFYFLCGAPTTYDDVATYSDGFFSRRSRADQQKTTLESSLEAGKSLSQQAR
jgi:hypothetical protein